MIRIFKNSEPITWRAYRITPGADYAPTRDLRQSLLEEQGYICAFCMRRIPVTVKDPGENEFSKIAHLESRANNQNRKLDYSNMVVCCPGNINGEAHCDKSQASSDISLPLFSDQVQNSISYTSQSGEIRSSNPIWERELNHLLNLNNPLLKANRREALEGVRVALGKKNQWSESDLRERYQQWIQKDSDGKFRPYCGIIVWYLKKKLGN